MGTNDECPWERRSHVSLAGAFLSAIYGLSGLFMFRSRWSRQLPTAEEPLSHGGARDGYYAAEIVLTSKKMSQIYENNPLGFGLILSGVRLYF